MSIQHILKVPGVLDFDHVLSPAVRLGETLYLSGQTPRDETGEIVTGDIETLTRQCLRNLEAVMQHAGDTLKDLVKLTVYLKDMDDFPRVNSIFMEVLPSPKPTRTCVQVAKNPADVRIEIEGIARAPSVDKL